MSTICTPPAVTFWHSLRDVAGHPVRAGTWDPLFARLERRDRYLGDDRHPGWSPAFFSPALRSSSNVRALCALVLDYDGTIELHEACDIWKGYYGLAHTTRSHSLSAHHFRLVLPLSRPVSTFEYGKIWRIAFERAGKLVDPAPKDVGRFWYLPGVEPDGEFHARRLGGRALDVDSWLASAEAGAVPSLPASDVVERAIRYVSRMPAAVAGQRGHDATWAVARKLAQDFRCDEETTFRILNDHYNPRCTPRWSPAELRHKAREAVYRARVKNPVIVAGSRPCAR